MSAKNDDDSSKAATISCSDSSSTNTTLTTRTTQITEMLSAASSGNLPQILHLTSTNPSLIHLQHPDTGTSPLMSAASSGHLSILQHLIDNGAPWNAIDKEGKCAGNYAVEKNHQECVDYLVNAGVKAELILGEVMRGLKKTNQNNSSIAERNPTPIEERPSSKPEYLSHALRYNENETALLDRDGDAVMMEWERPLMSLHASIITSNQKHKRVLNIGFGMGIIDSILQNEWEPTEHVIIEAHEDVYRKMRSDGWDTMPSVRLCFGKWKDVLPTLILEGSKFDGVFFDTYGEDGMELEDFHARYLGKLLEQNPPGVYSFFNGLAPDNLFFHGVACQCIKLQLDKIGLEVEFYPCEISVDENEWKGVRRKYWHGNTYYLPMVTWQKKKEEEGTAENK